jgi:RNA polymerase sigma factor (sigma-70 family)
MAIEKQVTRRHGTGTLICEFNQPWRASMDLSTSSALTQGHRGQARHRQIYAAKESPVGNTACVGDMYLVASAKDGDHQAYAELCRRHSNQIFRTILRITGNVADAEDTLQETLLKGYVHIGRFEGRSAFVSWLTRIAINSALMLSRKKRSHQVDSFEGDPDSDDFKLPEPADTSYNPEECCIQNAMENELANAIRYLSPTLRVVVQIRCREDASTAEIAKMLGISIPAVKSRLLRARMQIRGYLDKSQRLHRGVNSRTLTAFQLRSVPSMPITIEEKRSSGMEAVTPLSDDIKADVQENKRTQMMFNPSPRKYSILCVDDDRIGLELRAALLEEEGYSVTAVTCPLVALTYDVSKFDLAILDFEMPALSGFQLLLRLRDAHASFPIVLLSGMARDLPNRMRMLFSSCHDKAEPIHLLLNTVRSHLPSIPDTPECWVMGSDAHPLYQRSGFSDWEN